MDSNSDPEWLPYLSRAFNARAGLLLQPGAQWEGVLRLFNGYLEGPAGLSLTADLYGRTLLLQNDAAGAEETRRPEAAAQAFYREQVPWLETVVVKIRTSSNPQDRRGALTFGGPPDQKVRENGVWYALDLRMNSATSLFLDTSGLRAWLKEEMGGRSVLNTFAYTGSLGVAARAGGASRVIHLDLNRRFLEIGKASYALNGFEARAEEFIAGDFWSEVNALKRRGELFDCVLLDPPFFSTTRRGRVDLVHESQRVINKVRPLVAHGGILVAINNALFVSGAEYLHLLESLCADGYLKIEELIPVPEEFTGFPQTRVRNPPADPAPFNHSTKIAILSVRRKDFTTEHT